MNMNIDIDIYHKIINYLLLIIILIILFNLIKCIMYYN